MATSGQLKAKIDVLKKKIVEKRASLAPGRRRQLAKRLRRLQRARRTATAVEKKREADSKARKSETKSGGAVVPSTPAAGVDGATPGDVGGD